MGERSFFILSELGLAEFDGEGVNLKMEIDPYLVENACCRRAYIRGAFLGSGSCTLPKEDESGSGYHLEIVFFGEALADNFCDLLAQFDVLAKCVQRKNSYVVYLKSKDSISDFLQLCGAENCLEKLDGLAERREMRNNINRVANCMQKNYDKSDIGVRKADPRDRSHRFGHRDIGAGRSVGNGGAGAAVGQGGVAQRTGGTAGDQQKLFEPQAQKTG